MKSEIGKRVPEPSNIVTSNQNQALYEKDIHNLNTQIAKLQTTIEQKDKKFQSSIKALGIAEDQLGKIKQRLSQNDNKIQQLIENLAIKKKQLKQVQQKYDLQEITMIQLKKSIQEYQMENTQIKLRNKSLTTDNKIAISHLDKLIKAQINNRQVNAKTLFEEKQKRVIQSLYNKTISDIVINPQNHKHDFLPSQRNELSNKIKYQQLLQHFKTTRDQLQRQITKLKLQKQNNQNQIASYKENILNLKNNIFKLNQIKNKIDNSHQISLSTIGQLEEKIAILQNQNAYLRNQQRLRSNYYYPDDKLLKIKTNIGSIVNYSNRIQGVTIKKQVSSKSFNHEEKRVLMKTASKTNEKNLDRSRKSNK